MNAGLKVYNSNNTLQLDSTYTNFSFLGKGTFTFGSSNEALNPTVDINFNKNELIAFCVTKQGTAIGFYQDPVTSGDTTTYKMVTNISGTTVEYFRFGAQPGVCPPGNFFEVFDANGNRIYSDTNTYMKVLGFYSGTFTPTNATSSNTAPTYDVHHATINYDHFYIFPPTKRKVAIVIGLSILGEAMSSPLSGMGCQGFYVDNFTDQYYPGVYSVYIDWMGQQPDSMTIFRTKYNYMAVEVTGL